MPGGIGEVFSRIKEAIHLTFSRYGGELSTRYSEVAGFTKDKVLALSRAEEENAALILHHSDRGPSSLAPSTHHLLRRALPLDIGGILGSEVEAWVARSPTLTSQLADLEHLGWRVCYGPYRGGSYANRDLRLIVIDNEFSKNNGYVVRALAHEVGHAHPSNDTMRMLPYSGESEEEWIRKNVDHALRDEGQATFNEAEVLWEIARGGDGPYAAVAGKHSLEYEEIYSHYTQGRISKDAAIDRMAVLHADETVSIGSGDQTYHAFFADLFKNDFKNGGFEQGGNRS